MFYFLRYFRLIVNQHKTPIQTTQFQMYRIATHTTVQDLNELSWYTDHVSKQCVTLYIQWLVTQCLRDEISITHMFGSLRSNGWRNKYVSIIRLSNNLVSL